MEDRRLLLRYCQTQCPPLASILERPLCALNPLNNLKEHDGTLEKYHDFV